MEKERRTKALVIVVMLIVVAGLTVAFASLSSVLNIKGTAYLDAAKWGIKFQNLSEPVSVGKATTTGKAKIEETKSAEITGINVSLSIPGDKIVYTLDLVNEGTINAKIDNIEKTELTEEQQKYLTFKITYANGLEVSEGDILSKGETKKLIITIEFIKDLTKEDLPTSTSTISLSYKLNFVQTDEEKDTTSSEGQNELPSGYKKVEYLESTGTQYINTKILHNLVYGYEISFESVRAIHTVDPYNLDGVFGVNNSGVDTKLWFSYSDDKVPLNHSTSILGAETGRTFDIVSGKVNIVARNGVVIYNNKDTATFADFKSPLVPVNIYIFCVTDNIYYASGKIHALFFSATKIYSLKFYDSSDLLISNYVPCLDSDNKPCMYDTVSKKTFYNSGTGEFLYGNIIQ